MVKPSSSVCNMACEYCFYHSLSSQRESVSLGQMSHETVEEVISKGLKYADGAPLYLSFQGGEPLLRGKDFFRFVSAMLAKHNLCRSQITLAMQTNGLLIDEEWCDIFLESDWLVGLSLDGDSAANAHRVDTAGNPVFDRVLGAAGLLKKRGVQFNVLSVITEQSAQNIGPIYKFLTSKGFRHLQFIPCLKPLGCEYSPLTVTEKTYGDYLIELFKLYFADIRRGNYVSVRQMDNFVLLSQGRKAEQCGMNGECGRQFVVEGDGSVFPCDFYCLDEFRLGNILHSDFLELGASEKAAKFLSEAAILPQKCKECKYFRLCRGGCKRERCDLDKCGGYIRFLDHAVQYLRGIH